jgi:hypothetical protein
MKGSLSAHIGEKRHAHLEKIAKATHPMRSGIGNKTALIEDFIDKGLQELQRYGNADGQQFELEVTLRPKAA